MAARSAPRWAWIAGVSGILIALLVFAPARWLGAALSELSKGQVQVVNAQGTVWSGRGDLLLSGGEGSRGATSLPQGLIWKLRPSLKGGPGFTVSLRSPCCTDQPIIARVLPAASGGSLRFEAFSSRWPAGLLVGLGTPWNTLRMDGLLQLQTPGFTVALKDGRPRLAGTVLIEALDLSTRVSTLRPLGSYRVAVVGAADQDDATLTLSTISGGLQLQGEGQWVGGRLRFRGDAKAAPGQETALANLLSIIGRREGKRSLLTFG